jgi:hypothetical protein
LIIWSYCSAMMPRRIGRDNAGPSRGYAPGLYVVDGGSGDAATVAALRTAR